jgi:hypothetical protein
MWANAAKQVAKFSEGVLTAVDAQGYPVSVRQLALPYDAADGTMRITLPDALGAIEGPANLLCHFHDDKMWNMRAIQLKGRIERRNDTWVFVTTSFAPPSPIQLIRGIHRSTRRYLEKRGLPKPVVAFDAIEKLWGRARQIENP